MNLCKDCKHYKYNPSNLDWCMLPGTTKVNLVTGEPMYEKAWALRHGPYTKWCGKDGKAFVAITEVKEEVKEPWYKKWLKFIY